MIASVPVQPPGPTMTVQAKFLLVPAALAAMALGACQPAAPEVKTCKLEGRWLTTASGGQRTWIIAADGSVTSADSDWTKGKAKLDDHKLTFEFEEGPQAGIYTLNLSPDCRTAEGTVEVTRANAGWPLTKGPVTAEQVN